MFVDIHAHLNFHAFAKDRDEVIKRTLAGGTRVINVGTQQSTSRAALALAEAYDGLYATVGLHPIHTDKSFHDEQEVGEGGEEFTSRGEKFDAELYRELATHPKVVAIGECGLDFYRLGAETKAKQEEAFRAHIALALALELDKPLMIHCRDAHEEVLAILREYKKEAGERLRGNIHFYSGTLSQAQEYWRLGFTLSFTGVITFARDRDEMIKILPLEAIMIETDAPYVAPTPNRGKRNEPLYVIEVARKIAQLRGVPLEEIAQATTANAKRVFGI